MGKSLHIHEAKPSVLVVEDVEDIREMYVEYLTFLGFEVEGAEDGRDAVRKAISRHRALIVMDLAMPVLNGWEAIRILRADPRTRNVPIVVLTGHAQPEPIERARQVGATEVLTKPCLPAQLGQVIVAVLARMHDEGATSPSSSKLRSVSAHR